MAHLIENPWYSCGIYHIESSKLYHANPSSLGIYYKYHIGIISLKMLTFFRVKRDLISLNT